MSPLIQKMSTDIAVLSKNMKQEPWNFRSQPGLQCVILGGGSSRRFWSHILWAFVGSFSKPGHRWLLLPNSLQTLYLPGHAAKERERVGERALWARLYTFCFPSLPLLCFSLLSSLSLAFFSLFPSLPPFFLPSSVFLSFLSLLSTSHPPLFLSMVAPLMKCYSLASLQNYLEHFKTRFSYLPLLTLPSRRTQLAPFLFE